MIKKKKKKKKRREKRIPTSHYRKATLRILELSVGKVMGLRDASVPPLKFYQTLLEKSSQFCTLGYQSDLLGFQYLLH